ncbi:hypothetical protein CIPAW_05G202400 [Carya illinoinensis]|uniref:Uncharacterized protein n=1 Tax=Carya illinoinensis TaxID=32201 RepID=A0A8T1QLH4_CARIL|nr:hypothetical protein CIPAW_05G202400 [Carya illinoinensis]
MKSCRRLSLAVTASWTSINMLLLPSTFSNVFQLVHKILEACVCHFLRILNSLTQALQPSRVDLSQACILVQINAGKPANSRLNGVASNSKDDETESLNDQVTGHAVVGNCLNESGLAHKRLRTKES